MRGLRCETDLGFPAAPAAGNCSDCILAEFEVCPSAFDERAVYADNPAAPGRALARGKCLAVAAQHPGRLVLGSDTVVELEGPDIRQAGRRRRRGPDAAGPCPGAPIWCTPGCGCRTAERDEGFVDSCKVTFFPIPEEEIPAQHRQRRTLRQGGSLWHPGQRRLWLDRLEGDYYTIMGLAGSAAPCGCCTGLEAKGAPQRMKKRGKNCQRTCENGAL